MDKIDTEGRLGNGLKLNGVWKDYYDIIMAANENERYSNEVIRFLSEDKDSLAGSCITRH